MQLKTYDKSIHLIEPDQLDPNALYITDKLRQAGFEAYVVGGSIRDLLLGKKPKDFDISTSAKPEEIKRLFRNSLLIGRRFRLAHIRFGKKVFEVSTFRAGDNTDERLILRDNQWGNVEEDALRRDFTINGLFYDPANETILDYVGGLEDIKTHTLKTIGSPFIRFKQDPVRMIRLIKFQARFGFNLDSETAVALAECRSEILKSSQARIFEEFMRMLESGASAKFMRLLAENGFMELLAPGLNQCFSSPLASDMYSYLEILDGQSQDRLIGTAAMLLPILHQYLINHFEERSKHPHLGEIHDGAHQLIHEAFSPFFTIPKRFRSELAQVLAAQYRLTPLEPKKKVRAPNLESIHHSMVLLELRSQLEPTLVPIVEKWKHRLQKARSKGSSHENQEPTV